MYSFKTKGDFSTKKIRILPIHYFVQKYKIHKFSKICLYATDTVDFRVLTTKVTIDCFIVDLKQMLIYILDLSIGSSKYSIQF